MWYKKSYYETIKGTDESIEMVKTFREFYKEEEINHPKAAKELAMFGLNPQFFHSNSDSHYMAFFFKHKCDSTSLQPDPLPEFVCGDREFSESLSKKSDIK